MTKIIRKIGAIIQDESGKILVVRKLVPGRHTFIIPGGKPENDESELQALARELSEELGVSIESSTHFGDYVEPAEFEDARLEMSVYEVVVNGSPSPQSEIVEAIWIDSSYASHNISLGSTLVNHVIPQLVALGRM